MNSRLLTQHGEAEKGGFVNAVDVNAIGYTVTVIERRDTTHCGFSRRQDTSEGRTSGRTSIETGAKELLAKVRDVH